MPIAGFELHCRAEQLKGNHLVTAVSGTALVLWILLHSVLQMNQFHIDPARNALIIWDSGLCMIGSILFAIFVMSLRIPKVRPVAFLLNSAQATFYIYLMHTALIIYDASHPHIAAFYRQLFHYTAENHTVVSQLLYVSFTVLTYYILLYLIVCFCRYLRNTVTAFALNRTEKSAA